MCIYYNFERNFLLSTFQKFSYYSKYHRYASVTELVKTPVMDYRKVRIRILAGDISRNKFFTVI